MKLKLENRFLPVFTISFIVLILLTSYQNCSRTALQSNYSDQKTSTTSNPTSPTNAVRDVNTNCVLTQVSGPMIAVGAEFNSRNKKIKLIQNTVVITE
jgi:hypothetical protein